MKNAKKFEIFRIELMELLKKHEAEIVVDADDCSDWYGITGEHIKVNFRGDYKDQNGFMLTDSLYLTPSNLAEFESDIF
jgi:hypothetical protein